MKMNDGRRKNEINLRQDTEDHLGDYDTSLSLVNYNVNLYKVIVTPYYL